MIEKKVDDKMIEDMRVDKAAGMTQVDIAAKYNISQARVSYYIGAPGRHFGSVTIRDADDNLIEIVDGPKGFAKHFQITPGRAGHVLRQYEDSDQLYKNKFKLEVERV